MDREKLLEVIKQEDFDYTKKIDARKIHSIIIDRRNAGWCDTDFYIEWLTSDAGEWDMYLYLSYYDESIHHIVLVWWVDFYMSFDDENDIADFIENCYQGVKAMQEKFLIFKDK